MARAASPVPGPGILDIAPYVGGESKAAGVERPIRLASNESALGPSPKAIAAYKALADEIHRYPDGGAAELRAAIGRHHELDPERIVCGAGSDELIGMLLRAYAGPGDEVLYSRHGFLMYPIGALSAGAAAVEDVGALARARAHNERWLPWLSERLAALSLELTPSVGNFVLARFPDESRRNADAAFAFLQSRGILVRQMGGYGLPAHLRITIGTGPEMQAVAAALAEFMAAR